MTNRRWLAILSYFGLAPFLYPFVARHGQHLIRQALALFLVLWTLLAVFAAYGSFLSWMLVQQHEAYESLPLFMIDVMFGLFFWVWLMAWFVGLLFALTGSDREIPYLGRLAKRRLPIAFSMAATLLAWVATAVLVPMAVHSESLVRNDDKPARATMLYDDMGFVPRWVFTLGFYRISLAAQERWGPGHVVVAPLSYESLSRAIQHGRFVFVASHGGGIGDIAIDTQSFWRYIYSPADAQRAIPGRDLQFVYLTACDGGHKASAWISVLYPAEVVTFNRLSAVSEHVAWLWNMGPDKLGTITTRDEKMTPIALFRESLHNKWWNKVRQLISAYPHMVNQTERSGNNTALIAAVEEGDYELALFLIEHGADLDAQYFRGTALNDAALSGNLDLVKLLVLNNASLHPAEGVTALHRAASKGHAEIVTFLLQNGADVMAADRNGSTALHAAAGTGSEEVFRLLVQAGADVRATSHHGDTPLHAAASRGRLAIVQRLLELGADLNATNQSGRAPVNGAFYYHEVLALLLERGADARATRAGDWAKLDGNVSAALLQRLVRAGADVNVVDEYGKTPLHHAREPEIVNVLLSEGAKPNVQDDYGRTPLNEHADNSDDKIEILSLLLSAGATIDTPDHSGATPLHRAAGYGSHTAVELLLQHGAQVNPVDKLGRTPLDYGIFQVVGEAGQSEELSIDTINVNQAIRVKSLKKYGARAAPLAKEIAIMFSAFGGGYCGSSWIIGPVDIDAIRRLVDAHPSLANARNRQGQTLLETAINHMAPNLVVYLLENGADVTERTILGGTLLHSALADSSDIRSFSTGPMIAELLLKYNASVNATNYQGGTPLHHAVRKGSLKGVILLLAHSADTTIRDDIGKTALDYALSRGHEEIVKVLQRRIN